MQVVLEPKRLLGTLFDSPRRAAYAALFPWTKLSKASDGAIDVAVDAPELVARADELVGALVAGAAQQSLSASVFKFFGVTTVKKAVLAVPTHWSAARRQALLDASELAGVAATLVDELGAAAIDFAALQLVGSLSLCLFEFFLFCFNFRLPISTFVALLLCH